MLPLHNIVIFLFLIIQLEGISIPTYLTTYLSELQFIVGFPMRGDLILKLNIASFIVIDHSNKLLLTCAHFIYKFVVSKFFIIVLFIFFLYFIILIKIFFLIFNSNVLTF